MNLYQNCSNGSATLNKMVTRAINRNKLLMALMEQLPNVVKYYDAKMYYLCKNH